MPILTEIAINELIVDAKTIPDGLRMPSKPMSARNGHWQKGWEFDCDSGNRFVVKIRQACTNPMNFSVILGYMIPATYTVFRLRRYNGKSHFHTNTLEGEVPFYDYHIPIATERYQVPGFSEDHFAQKTDRFHDIASAIDCLVNDCGFRSPFAGTPLFPNL